MHLVYLPLVAFLSLGRVTTAAVTNDDFESDGGGVGAGARGRRAPRPAEAPYGEPGAEPMVGPTNAEDQVKTARRIARNQRRADIINQFMRKRNTPANVSAYVSSITVWNAPFESTVWSVYRGYEVGKRAMPFGGGNYYNGITPNYIEFKLRDHQKIDDVAYCVLDFRTSRLNPDRIFFRTRKCVEDQKLAHWADRRGFTFAGLVQVRNNQIEKFRDLTETDLLISDLRLRVVLEDPYAFNPRGQQTAQPPIDGEPTPSSTRRRIPPRRGGGDDDDAF